MAGSNALGWILALGAGAVVFGAIVLTVPRPGQEDPAADAGAVAETPADPETETPPDAALAATGEAGDVPEAAEAPEAAAVAAAETVEDPTPPEQGAEAAPAADEEPAPTPPAETAAEAAAAVPRLETVFIEADGNSVIAGRAAAGATVAILLGRAVLSEVVADDGGQFVALLTLPPAEEPRILSLLADPGGAEVASDETYIVAPFGPVAVADAETGAAETGAAETGAAETGAADIDLAAAEQPATEALAPDLPPEDGAGRLALATEDAGATAEGPVSDPLAADFAQTAPAEAEPAANEAAAEMMAEIETELALAAPDPAAEAGAETAGAAGETGQEAADPASGTAEAPEAMATAQAPEAPETADTPVSPDTPVTAEAADTAESADMASEMANDTAQAPDTTPETATETALATAEAPEAPGLPEASDAPEATAQLETPAQPEATAPPETPPQPEVVADLDPDRLISPADPSPVTAPPVLVAGASGVRVLQPALAPAAAPEVLRTVALDTISYDASGEVVVAGRASGGGQVRIYLDNAFVAEVEVGEDGAWSSRATEIAPGVYTMRVDQVDAEGRVASRIETPFQRAERAEIAAAMAERTEDPDFDVAMLTVQPGNTLWAIARDRYGDGILYVSVFEANRDRIRNPDLIYPGQVFVLPELDAEATPD